MFTFLKYYNLSVFLTEKKKFETQLRKTDIYDILQITF